MYSIKRFNPLNIQKMVYNNIVSFNDAFIRLYLVQIQPTQLIKFGFQILLLYAQIVVQRGTL